jgi:hypothetical protein
MADCGHSGKAFRLVLNETPPRLSNVAERRSEQEMKQGPTQNSEPRVFTLIQCPFSITNPASFSNSLTANLGQSKSIKPNRSEAAKNRRTAHLACLHILLAANFPQSTHPSHLRGVAPQSCAAPRRRSHASSWKSTTVVPDRAGGAHASRVPLAASRRQPRDHHFHPFDFQAPRLSGVLRCSPA